MASRESQGLQIALILFVMITVVLAVTTYIFFRKSEENGQQLTEISKRLSDMTRQKNAHEFAYKLARHMLQGGSSGAEFDQMKQDLKTSDPEISGEVEKIEVQFNADKQNYGAAEEDFTYFKLPEILINAINERNELVQTKDQEIANLKQQMADQLKDKDNQIAIAVKAQEQHLAQLRDAEAKFKRSFDEVTDGKKKLDQRIKETDEKYQKLQDVTDAKIGEMEKSILEKQLTISTQKHQIQEKNQENFDEPDGKILFVNPAADTVLINLGLADGLQRNLSFVVYDGDVGNFARAKSKGKIEVARVLDAHTALAKIVETQRASNPILSQDVIYTPTWRPGEKVQFALTGEIDVDDDGLSDREFIKGLIEQNGGEIVADADPKDNKRTGKMGPRVRYLVEGKPPKRTDQLKSHTQIINESLQYGVQRMSLEKFMSYMRFKPDTATVRLGRGGVDFQGETGPAKKADAAGVGAAGAFRERRPPARGALGGGY